MARLAVIPGSRGRPARVTLRATTALAAPMEGIALTDEVLASCDRITMAAAAGSRMAVVSEAGRLHTVATAARVEFRRLAGEVVPDGRAA